MVINAEKVEITLAERGMTWTQLSKEAGISRQNISTIMRRKKCTPRTAGKIASGLGVPVEQIIRVS